MWRVYPDGSLLEGTVMGKRIVNAGRGAPIHQGWNVCTRESIEALPRPGGKTDEENTTDVRRAKGTGEKGCKASEHLLSGCLR